MSDRRVPSAVRRRARRRCDEEYGAPVPGWLHYRRLAARVGKAKAITATARKLAILVYRALKGDVVYHDPGADAYDAQHRTQLLRRLRSRASKMGFALVDLQTGELLESAVS